MGITHIQGKRQLKNVGSVEKLRQREVSEHSTIYNGLLYMGDSAEGDDFRRMNDMLKVVEPDISWKTKTPKEKLKLQKAKSAWKAYLEGIAPEIRPKHS